LLFDWRSDIRNLVHERILHWYLQGHTSEEILATVMWLVEHLIGHCEEL